jgi:hypothetical protein
LPASRQVPNIGKNLKTGLADPHVMETVDAEPSPRFQILDRFPAEDARHEKAQKVCPVSGGFQTLEELLPRESAKTVESPNI